MKNANLASVYIGTLQNTQKRININTKMQKMKENNAYRFLSKFTLLTTKWEYLQTSQTLSEVQPKS